MEDVSDAQLAADLREARAKMQEARDELKRRGFKVTLNKKNVTITKTKREVIDL